MPRTLFCSAALIAFLSPTLATAQTAPAAKQVNSVIDEVIVTARKRQENSQDVPISMTAFSADALEQQQVITLEDLSSSVPNLSITKTQGSNNTAQVFLRGVGQDDSIVSVEPAIGLYVDGVPYVKAIGALIDMIEYDRVEVLRGPQGTLYGRNSTGGAIKFESRRPSFDAQSYVGDVTVGSYGRIDMRGSYNLPLSDTLAVKLDMISRSDDGYVENVSAGIDGNVDPHLNRTDRQSLRLAALWTPSDRLQISSAIDGTRDDSGPQTGIPLISSADADNLVGTSGAINQAAPLYGARRANPDILGPNSFSSWGGHVTATYDFDSVQFKSISAYRGFDLDQAIDTNGGEAVIGLVSQNGATINRSGGANLVRFWNHNTYTQEFQVTSLGDNKLDWVVGAFFMNEDNDDNTTYGSFGNDGDLAQRASTFDVEQTTKSAAVFGEVSYELTEKLEVTAGGRFTKDTKDYKREHLAALAPLPLFAGAAYLGETSQSFKDFSPKIAAKYKVNEDVLLYGGWSQGFQGGGFQGFEFGSGDDSNTPFNEATVESFEGGVKSQFMDNRLRLNANVFLSDYTDIPASVAAAAGGFVVNTSDVEIWGTEFEVEAVPMYGLTIYGMLSTLDNKYTKSALAPSRIPGSNGENKLKFTPELQWKFGGLYEKEMANGVAAIGVNLSHTGEFYTSATNAPVGFQDSYELLDAQISYTTSDDRWKLTLAGKNLTDSLYAPQITSAGSGAAFFAAPTTWSLTLRVKG